MDEILMPLLLDESTEVKEIVENHKVSKRTRLFIYILVTMSLAVFVGFVICM